MALSLSTLPCEEQKEQIPCLHGTEEKTKTHTLLCEFTNPAFEDSNFTNLKVHLCVFVHMCGCMYVCRCQCVCVSKDVDACAYVSMSACVCTCVQVHMHILECGGQRSTLGLVLQK